jgi:hypothetical protein
MGSARPVCRGGERVVWQDQIKRRNKVEACLVEKGLTVACTPDSLVSLEPAFGLRGFQERGG